MYNERATYHPQQQPSQGEQPVWAWKPECTGQQLISYQTIWGLNGLDRQPVYQTVVIPGHWEKQPVQHPSQMTPEQRKERHKRHLERDRERKEKEKGNPQWKLNMAYQQKILEAQRNRKLIEQQLKQQAYSPNQLPNTNLQTSYSGYPQPGYYERTYLQQPTNQLLTNQINQPAYSGYPQPGYSVYSETIQGYQPSKAEATTGQTKQLQNYYKPVYDPRGQIISYERLEITHSDSNGTLYSNGMWYPKGQPST
jgi:hypothetical protein